MKSSQSIPGPQSAASPMTGGAMAGSPQVPQSTAADPSQVSQDATPVPKPIYSGVDVSPEIAPASGGNAAQSPWDYMLKAAATGSVPSAGTAFNYMLNTAATKPNDQGQIVADALRKFAPGYRAPYDTSAVSSQSPARRPMGGWQSLMQRMQPR